MKKQTLIEKLRPARFQLWKQLVILALLILIALLLISGYAATKRSTLNQYSTLQMLYADQLAAEALSRFGQLSNILDLWSSSPDIIDLNRRGIETMENILLVNAQFVSAVTRVDENGVIVYTVPQVEGATGTDISGQSHIIELLDNRQPVLSGVFETVQGYQAIAYHMPVHDKAGEFRGSIALVVPFRAVMDQQLRGTVFAEERLIWIVDGSGRILFSDIPEQEGSIFGDICSSDDFHMLEVSVAEGRSGHFITNLDLSDSQSAESYLSTLLSFDILGERWTIVLLIPEASILHDLAGLRNSLLLGAMGILALAMLFLSFKLRSWISMAQEKKWSDVARINDLLRTTIDQADELIILLDERLRVLFANPAVKRVTGFGSEIFGKRLRDIAFGSMSPDAQEIQSMVRAKGRWMGIVEGEGTEGMHFKLSLSVSSSTSLDGSSTYYTLIARDVTVQSEMERRLHEQQKMEAIGQLAGGVAHDFNNLLVGIQGYAELLERRYSDEPEIVRSVKVIQNAVFRGSELTRQLLGFARKGKHKIEPVDLATSVRNVCRLLGRTLDHRIEVELDLAPDITVMGDPSQLEQVILNLAVNARDAMPNGGVLRFTLEKKHIPGVVLSGRTETDSMELAILRTEDTGSGIAPEDIDRIFEPFFTTKMEEGTGMGLATAFGIVANHGGWIDVESPADVGTIFTIYLPLGQTVDPERNEDISAVRSPPVTGKGTVLLIDDELVVLNTTTELLMEIGYDVLNASNGAAAIELFRSHTSDIDAIVLDLSMPGMDGRACFIELRKLDQHTPVILASGFSRDGRVQELLDLGINEYLQKPYTLSELADTLQRLMNGHEHETSEAPHA